MKLAHLLKEHTDAEIYNFYIDMRTPGKGYEEFYDKLAGRRRPVHPRAASAKSPTGRMTPDEEGKLVIRVEDTLAGFVRRIPVDMIVLATGLEPQADAQDVRRLFNMSCGSEGFFLERHPEAGAGEHLHRRRLPRRRLPGARATFPTRVAQAGAAAAEAHGAD